MEIRQFAEVRRHININSLGHSFHEADLTADYPTSYILRGRGSTTAFVTGDRK